ncbi:hypothetical protein BH23CHL8_BH23CHL8_09880 [soil metagenome]
MDATLIEHDDPRWTAMLHSTAPDFYHLPGYVAASASHERGEAAAILVEDGARTMLLPFILRATPDGRRDATSPQGYAGFLASPDSQAGFITDALRAAIVCLRVHEVVSLYVRLHPLLNSDPPEGVGDVVRHPDTVPIDLSLAPDELWRQTRPRFRSHITHALRAGHRVDVETGAGSLKAFKDLYRATMRRLSAAPAYQYDDAYFEALRESLGEALHVASVTIEGQTAATGLYVEGAGIVHLHLAGSDPRFTREQPTKLMYHRMREWSKERGSRWMLLGGGRGTEDDSLLHFKAGFSPLRAPYRTLRVIILAEEYQALVADRFPEGVPPSATGFFPLYRAP